MKAEPVFDLSVVIPIYNEASLLPELQSRLERVLSEIGKHFEVIYVDDGSEDSSLEVLGAIRGKDSRVKIVELSRNFGQTAALAAGLEQAQGKVVITMDGDLQHEPEQIPAFLSEIEKGYDLVNGWRQVRTDSFFLRRLPSKIANSLMRFASGVAIKDFGSTFKAYRYELLDNLELFGELHRFIPVLAARVGARMAEIPIEVHERKQGDSKYGLARSFGVFQDLIFLEFYFNYLTKPIRAFGKLFYLFFGCGFLIAVALMLLWAFGTIERVLEHGALLLLSVLLMVIGIQFLAVGILAELLSRIYHHTSGTKIYSVRKVH